MVEPVVDGAREVFGIPGAEQTALVKGELPGGRERAVGDDRHQTRGERLDAGDGLRLHIRRVHVEVALTQQLNELFLR